VLNAVGNVKFHSNLQKGDLFTAKNAIRKEEGDINPSNIDNHRFLFSVRATVEKAYSMRLT
jgi:hypothetical protein